MQRDTTYVITSMFAVLVISFDARGELCSEQVWNQTISSQQRVDDWYNRHAESFNNLLLIYKQHIFLHKEFTQDELYAFWHPSKIAFNEKLESHILATQNMQLSLTKEHLELEKGYAAVTQQEQQWRSLNEHCAQSGSKINAHSSMRYVVSNQSLKTDIETLISKIDTLKIIYKQEEMVLLNSRDQDAPISIPMEIIDH